MKDTQGLFCILFFILFSIQMNAQCFTEQTFTTPGQSTFTVPGTVGESYLIEIEAEGADGGDFLWGANPQTAGGTGANMKASFVVPGGSDLLVVVGSSGFDAPGSPGGGGGGGGTAVILDNTDVLIAAGAGGGGGQGAANTGQGGQANTDSPAVGGLGLGSSGGGGFNADGGDGPASTGGDAGTLSGQGSGGNGGVTAGNGGAGFGGGGGGSGTVGGGGGGYKGGDGSDGSADLNGKGGDSFVNTLFSGSVISNTPGINGGGTNNNGSVTITCIPQSSVEISLVVTVDPLCFGGFGGAIEVAAMGGLEPYQYSLNGGTYGDSPIFDGLSGGTYTVTVQDGTGATDMLTVMLISPSEIIGEIINITDNVCFGASEGSIEVSASGGTSANGEYGYSINGSSVQSSGTFMNLPNGFYVISIFDDNLCTTQLTATIASPEDLDLILNSKIDNICFGLDNGAISVDAFGGSPEYMFAIDEEPFGNSSQFNNLAGGTYVITVMDSEGCTEELIVFIDVANEIEFDIMTTPTSCYDSADGVISINNAMGGTGPLTFNINFEDQTTDTIFTGLAAGQHFVSVFDSVGCISTKSINIVSPENLVLNVTVVMDVLCEGDSTGAVILELENGVGEITYSVDQTINFTGLFENLAAGEYTASGTDENGCTTELTFEIQETSTFQISSITVFDVTCFDGTDGSIIIEVEDAIEPIQYSIDGINFQESPEFNGLMAGDYEFEVVDSTGCPKTSTMTVGEPTQLEFDYFTVNNVACYGDFSGQINYSVTGGSPDYSYDDNGQTTTFGADDTVSYYFLEAGDFVVSLMDSNGCELTDTVTISQNDSLVLFVSTIAGDKCGEEDTGSVDLNATGGYAPLTITVNGESSTDGVFDSLAAGNYTAIVEDDLGCMAVIDFNIPQLDGLQLDSLTIGDVSCSGEADGYVEFFISNANGNIIFYLLDIVFTESLIEELPGGVYTFTAEDEEGCILEIDVVINEPDPLMIEVIDANLGEGYIVVEAVGGTQPYRYSIDDKVTYQDSTTFTDLEPGEYTLIVIDDNGCESSVMYSLVGLNDSDFEGLNIYPNPVNNVLHVDFEGISQDLKLDIINKLGQVIKTFDNESKSVNGTVMNLPINGISTGTYVLRLIQNDKVGFYQIVIIN